MRRRSLVAFALAVSLVAFAHADENPLAKAKAGEWIIQKNVIGGSMTMFSYVFVEKVDGKKVYLVTQPLQSDLKTGAGPAQKRDPVDADKARPATKALGEEQLEAKGKKLKCKKAEATTETKDGRLTTTTWTCAEVPVYGVVREIVKDGSGKEVLRTDLVDWGTEGGKEKAVAAAKDEKK